MRHDGSRELTLPLTCQLKRYTARQAGMCLKNKSLLFIGDSLTRYQYLSLAYFLEHKQWPPRYQATGYHPCLQVDEHNNTACSNPDKPNVCCEYDWELFGNGGWTAFMQNLGGGTDGRLFRGRMEAQSVRGADSVENYQYLSSEEDGRTKMSLISEYGWNGNEPFRGWSFSGFAHNGTCRYTPESYQNNLDRLANNNFDYDYPNITTAFKSNSEFHAQHQNTNYIFYNRGLWGALQADKANSMMEAIQNMTGGKDVVTHRCFFKSTTGCHRSRQNNLDSVEYGHVRTATYSSGCEYFDVAHATEEFSNFVFDPKPPPMLVNEFKHVFWDSLHFVSLLSQKCFVLSIIQNQYLISNHCDATHYFFSCHGYTKS
jgi:hypothetical protein